MKTIKIVDPKYQGEPTQKRTVAVVIFYDENGKVLLQNRKSISKAGEEWGLFGGGIEKGENPSMALERELEEEVSGLPQNVSFEKICEEHVIYFNRLTKRFHELYKFIFASELPIGLKLKVNEGDGACWFNSEDAIHTNMIPGNSEAIKLFVSR